MTSATRCLITVPRYNKIPAHYNVVDQFDRSIVSIDTLKRDARIRDAIKYSYWDLIIIDGPFAIHVG